MSNALDFSIDSNSVATLSFNSKEEKVNKLSESVLVELEDILKKIADDKKIQALIIRSKKVNNFIAGADISEIRNIKDRDDAYKKVILGQEILSRIADLKIPTIAIIDGSCLGGGLELALACDYRIASDNSKTILGLPEVNLGIIPGFGGTQRLPKLIGLTESLKMILSGKAVDARKAYKIGLVDSISTIEFLDDNIENFIAHLIVNGGDNKFISKRRKIRKKRFFSEVILGGKYLIFYLTKKELLKKTKGHYPAPLAAFDVIKRTYHCLDYSSCFKVEAEEFSKLAAGDIAKNLIEIFFINEEIKKDNGLDYEIKATEIKSAGLLGAGVMGGGIAWLFSNYDISIRMKDISWSGIALGYKQVRKIYNQLRKIKKYDDNQINLKFNKISSTIDYTGFENVDIAIEAIIENIDIKKQSLKELESKVDKSTIIASNTSSLSINEMSKSLNRPENFIGMHFFNPVNKMPLVEVIKGKKTSDLSIATIVALAKKMKKTPIVVSDVAGFLVNRILIPYINEAGFLLEDGADIRNIDNLIEEFGMPMGPFTLADAVGIDVGIKVAQILNESYGDRMKVCNILQNISQNKDLLGKKSNAGFYNYSKDGEKFGVNSQINDILNLVKNRSNKNLKNKDIVDRCILIMINEAAKCLEENVVKNHRYLDMAMIMGTGFPPFRGGLLRYADSYGIDNLVNKLQDLEKSCGIRFKPSDLLIKMQETKEKFYN